MRSPRSREGRPCEPSRVFLDPVQPTDGHPYLAVEAARSSMPAAARRPTHGAPAGRVRIKRAYEPPSPTDGTRVLVDRLWPRGIRKEAAHLARWARDVAPSAALCEWYGHVPERFPEFRTRYRAELAANPAPVAALAELARAGTLTLVFAARDTERSNAEVLREYLAGRLAPRLARGAGPRRGRARTAQSADVVRVKS